MRCLTEAESKDWALGHGWPINPTKPPETEVFGITGSVPPPFTRVFWFSEFLSKSLGSFDSCMLHVKLWGVWPSSENLHLFYKLRETYGERRLLLEAPGHLFQKYELADLSTFIQIAILCGWDFDLHSSPSWIQGFVSHDEWFELFATDENNLKAEKEALKAAKINFEEFRRPISESRII